MLTCKINKPQAYLVTRETTSTVHLKASKVSFYAPVCQLNTESHLTEFQGQVLPGNKMVGGVLQEQKTPQFCGTKSFPPGTKAGCAMQLWSYKMPKSKETMEIFRNLVL